MKESVVERYLTRRVKACGGLCYKWVSPSNSGVPDRIVLLNRRVAFVELKRPGGKPRPLQKYVLGQLSSHGYHTAVVDSCPGADLLIEEMMGGGDEDEIRSA